MTLVRTGPTRARLELAARARQRREQGWLNREIAAEFGISVNYASALIRDPDGAKSRARKDSYRGRCERCGGETTGSEGRGKTRHCANCARELKREAKVWTRDAIVDAVRRFACEYGRPPYTTDWLRADPGRGYPAASTCYSGPNGRNPSAPFVRWADAIEAAGFPRPRVGGFPRTEETRRRMSESHTVWTRGRIVEAIRTYVARHGVVPSYTRLKDARSELPNPGVLRRHGVRWVDLVREAGFEPVGKGRRERTSA